MARMRSSETARAQDQPRGSRTLILRQAARLFAQQGVASTTVREIGDAAGILSGSLYHHFRSKDAMLEEIIVGYLDGLLDRYRRRVEGVADPRQQFVSLIRESFAAIDEYSDECEIYQSDLKYLRAFPGAAEIAVRGDAVQRIWTTVIGRGVEAGTLRDDIDAQIFYRLARDAVWFVVRWGRRPTGPAGIEELTVACSEILLDGFAR